MNGIKLKSVDFTITKWRKDDVDFHLSEYIPFLLKKLNSKYSEVKRIEINDLDMNDENHGFRYSNLKKLNVILETIKGQTDINLYLPVPGNDDIFIINKKPYILVNQLIDDIFYFQNKDIFTISFRINHDTGGWIPFKGSQAKAQKQIPIIHVMQGLGILEDYFPNPEFVKSKPDHKLANDKHDPTEDKFVWKISDDIYFLSDNFKTLTNTHKLVLKSLDLVEKYTFQNTTLINKLMKTVESQSPFSYSYEYEFTKGYSDLVSLYKDIFTHYNEDKYHKFDDIHLDFKRIRYYAQVLDPLATRVRNIKTMFNRARNLTSDINWNQKIPNNMIIKYIRKYKYLQYLELNIFTEIDYKYKCVIPLNNVPKSMRSTSWSGVHAICPLNSPDNKSIGIVQSLVTDCKLDKYGKFKDFRPIL